MLFVKNTEKLISEKKPLMVAHRGVSGLERENTHAAFIAAGNRSYWGIETDVHRTADGVYVCIHDSTTKRVGIDDVNVELCTYDTVRNLTLCGPDGTKDRSDVKIPTMIDYIRICKDYGKIAVLELKQNYTKEQLAEICRLIDAEGWLEKTVFIAFGLENLILLRELSTDQPAQYLIGKGYFDRGGTNEELLEILIQYNLDLDIDFHCATKDLVSMVHEAGKIVNVWTVNTVEDALACIEAGVDQMTTNILE